MPPAGHGIKGKGTKLPLPAIFSVHLLSNWEPGQKYKPGFHSVVLGTAEERMWNRGTPFQSFHSRVPGLGADVRLRPIMHLCNLKHLPLAF